MVTTRADNEISSEISEQHNHPPKPHQWLLLLLYCAFLVVGNIGAPLLQKLYYTQGGSLKWFQSCLQSIGILILLPQILVLYLKTELPAKLFFMDLKLFYWSLCIGILVGLTNYLSSAALSLLPLSTTSLLFSTQLVFTAFFTFTIVRQKFTFYSSISIVAITLSAVVLALHSSSDMPSGVTNAMYLLGFFLTLSAAASTGLSTPLYQLAFSMSSRSIDYLIMMQVMVVGNLSGALFSIVGMIINKEFQAMSKDAKEFSLGEEKYCMIAVATAILWQFALLGTIGIIRCRSSLFASICIASLLPVSQVAAVITFHDKFTKEKAISLALCLLGFAFYFIGEFRTTQKTKCMVENTLEDAIIDRKNYRRCPN